MISNDPFKDMLERMDKNVSWGSVGIGSAKWNSGIRDAAIGVHDTFDLCHKIAQSVFGPKIAPEITVALYDRLLALIDKNKSEFPKQSEDDSDEKLVAALREEGIK